MNLDFEAFLAFNHANSISPIGIRFGIKSGSADFFVLSVVGEEDAPIRLDGQMLAFPDEDGCRKALVRLEREIPQQVRITQEYDFLCDIPEAIQIVTKEKIDREGIVLDCINTLLDFGSFSLPAEYRVLVELVDHLTFREELAAFDAARGKLRDALLWCAGNTVMDLRVLQATESFETLLPNLSAFSKRKPT